MTTISSIDEIQKKFSTTRAELYRSLIEREEEIDIVLTSLVCQENPLFVGPPGTGKSLLLDSALGWMGGNKFTCLLTKFSTPEEIFGPISVAGLKDDKYVRITRGRLPEADGAFIDEIFKASSAILNTLLRILNERVYDKGDGVLQKTPLKVVVAASNEWPGEDNGGKELGALFDRFLFRRQVRSIASAKGRRKLLWERDHTPTLSTSLAPEELDAARAAARSLPWSTDGMEAMEEILRRLGEEGIVVGDRRQYKAVGAVQASAWIEGATEVVPENLGILQHILWEDPVEQPTKAAEVIRKIANPTGMAINQFLLEAEEIISKVDVRNIAKATEACGKLAEIDAKLAKIKGGNGRALKARTYVRDEAKRIRVGAVENAAPSSFPALT